MADLYGLLGVSRDATQDEIKRAYRRQARSLHPDAGGDEEAFKNATRAYEVLSDPQRRARYDRFGDEGERRSDPFADFAAGFGAFGGLSDVIDAFFGGGSFGGTATRPRASSPGRDVLVTVELDLEEVATGVRREVEVDVAARCDACDGTGSQSGKGAVTCPTCGGAGQVRRIVRSAFGQVATARPCPSCEGNGRNLADPCQTCRGEGRHATRRTITVDIPPGVEDGTRLRIAGAGEAGRRGAPPGDLYVETRVRPHEVFNREGRELWCDVTVPLVHAALGATLHVPTLGGENVAVDLPAGTQPGDVFTVRRAGIPRQSGHDPGDLHVRVNIEVPRAMSDEEEQLLRQFAELRGENLPPSGRGLFRRLREAFR